MVLGFFMNLDNSAHIGWYTVEPRNDWELRWTSILELLGRWFRIVFDSFGRSAGSNKLYSCISQTCWKRSSMFDPLSNHFLWVGCKKTLSTKNRIDKQPMCQCVQMQHGPSLQHGHWGLEEALRVESRSFSCRFIRKTFGSLAVKVLLKVFSLPSMFDKQITWILDWLQ